MLKNGKFIQVRDEFLKENDEFLDGNGKIELVENISKNNPFQIYFLFTGVQCSGKTYIREYLQKQYGGFARSQDECGSNRTNLINEIIKWSEFCEKNGNGLYTCIIDRCNLNISQRLPLYNDLKRVRQYGLIIPINVVISEGIKYKDMELLCNRFISRKDHSNFSIEKLGIIKSLQILKSSYLNYKPVKGSAKIN